MEGLLFQILSSVILKFLDIEASLLVESRRLNVVYSYRKFQRNGTKSLLFLI